jgi:hypothetical protein
MRHQYLPQWFVAAALAALLAVPGCASNDSSSSTDTSSSSSSSSSGSSGGTSGGSPVVTVVISAHPQSVKAAVGTAVSLTVAATGSGTLSYQWYKGGAAVTGATSATCTMNSLAAADAGRYHVRVTDANGSVASNKAVVTPTSGGAAVDVWDYGDGFNPADDVANVTFAYTVTLTGTSSGITAAATGLTTSSATGNQTTFSDGSKTVVVDAGATPITITSTITSGLVKYVLNGSFLTGFKVTSASPLGLGLSDVTVATTSGSAIYVNSAVRTFVVLSGTSTLAEASSTSSAVGAAFYSKGALLFSGGGTLNVTAGSAYETHGIQSKTHVRVSEGTLALKTRYNPTSKDVNTSSVYALNATTAFVMDGGVLIINSADELSGLARSIPAGWGRGIGVKGAESSTGFIVVNDGVMSIATYDKAMTAKWKCYDSTSPSESDGDAVCNASDPNPFVTIHGGTITIRATGIPCDPTDRMTYNTTTCTGAASAKVSPEGIEAKSIFTVNGGTIDIQSSDDAVNAGISYTNPYGNAVVINGGLLNAASSGNDGIDANAISSPGITINGGVVVANGIGAPEEGFDADRYTVALNGGIAIGTGGNNSTVDTGSTGHYASVTKITAGRTLAVWKGTSTQGSLAFAYQVPTATSASLSALISSGTFVAGGTYAYFFTDASNVSCSEWFHGLCVGTMSATYSTLGTATTLTVK